ncbi:MAG: oxygen-insensitive NAD(P)H nitroreductase [Azonexus sp.]|nr:oxygen-insensitive NAD(P)H nitroreductase [Azonexus sp.]MCK6412101.1 oxygen-insensitive NAD(P)H nitroreductase [Azonexus sp.]
MQITQVAQRRHTTKAFDPDRRLSAADLAAVRILLRNAASSVNSQPWHFVIASSEAGRGMIADTMKSAYAYNEGKVRKASQVIVFCGRKVLDEAYLASLLEQEAVDGRLLTPEARAIQEKTRAHYVGLHRDTLGDLDAWVDRQVYLALGSLLLGVAALQLDACPLEGFDPAAVDAALGLPEKGLRSVVMLALGHRGEDDFNAALPKSRLPETVVFSEI